MVSIIPFHPFHRHMMHLYKDAQPCQARQEIYMLDHLVSAEECLLKNGALRQRPSTHHDFWGFYNGWYAPQRSMHIASLEALIRRSKDLNIPFSLEDKRLLKKNGIVWVNNPLGEVLDFLQITDTRTAALLRQNGVIVSTSTQSAYKLKKPNIGDFILFKSRFWMKGTDFFVLDPPRFAELYTPL